MSTVVLSNLPMGCIESDIHRALLMYGTAVNIEMNSHASQATVTMRTKQEAQALLNRRSVNVIGTSVRVDAQVQAPPPPQQLQPQHQHQPPQQQQMVPQPPPHLQQQQVGSYGYGSGNVGQQQQPIYGNMAPQQYPQHELNHQPQHLQQQYAQPQPSYPQQPQQMPLQSPPQSTGSYVPNTSHRSGSSGQAIMPVPPQPSRRLRVLVEDCRYPITRDVLMQMFSMIAPPVSVSCGPYGPTTTGAVEFADATAAQQAMDQFHNNAIYPNCCYVKLFFEPMWDRVDPVQPPMQSHQPHSYGGSNSGYGYPAQGPTNAPPSVQANPYSVAPHGPAQSDAYGAGWGGSDGAQYYGGSVQSSAAPPSQPGQPATDPFGRRRGGCGAGSDSANDNDPAAQHGSESRATRGMAPGPMVRGGRGAMRGGIGGRGSGTGLGAATGFSPFEPSGAPPARGGGAGVGRYPGLETNGCTVMVSCVNESVPLYDLWVLLEVFGNVNSLKRQFRDRTNVVAQFQHPGDTLTAIQYLQHCPFRGSVLRLKRFSGYQDRDTEWETKSSTDPATMAALFTTGYHHRTAPRAPVNVRGRVHPDKNLYITNLTEAISDDELKGIMKDAGFEPHAFFRRGPKGAIVAYKDTETAVDALIALHAKEVRERFLRVTFSRFPPGPRPSRDGVDKGDDDDDGDAEQRDGQQETQSEPPPQQQQVPEPSQLNEPAPQESAEPPAPPPQEPEPAPEEADGGEVESAVPEAAPKVAKVKAKPSKR
ncbi:DRBD4 / RNA recognition motif-containing protein [Leishmania donovani]|uniref:RNA_recognition_motif_(A.k.a._RRM_RBD_or_RNP_doma in)/RNA_recognition_motif._(A.k.a._RRM_RBD_or_RNP_domain)_p utative/Pfam:PF14259/Pfam:PF00076 n=1 Tax=Leishmania donovani TaxID=5661 RepID=A0A6J8FMC8_LEIDO|nr:DRBD4 / RNA recognition motif-containing protein [Leishmania donovani]VDZ47462.1 RNA_recognition_motif_(a.k.a._RRM_RBD_or_RNP_domain)/RNA_recognition_motif._(a.k.a._RRM_RBD_or_RNP_domain)_putative/Pfam:PF14259/Pfam:PF00076 [Leishmania donovani]